MVFLYEDFAVHYKKPLNNELSPHSYVRCPHCTKQLSLFLDNKLKRCLCGYIIHREGPYLVLE